MSRRLFHRRADNLGMAVLMAALLFFFISSAEAQAQSDWWDVLSKTPERLIGLLDLPDVVEGGCGPAPTRATARIGGAREDRERCWDRRSRRTRGSRGEIHDDAMSSMTRRILSKTAGRHLDGKLSGSRGVAQPGRALALGARSRWFESSRPDHCTKLRWRCFIPRRRIPASRTLRSVIASVIEACSFAESCVTRCLAVTLPVCPS